jgi:hypothetical protein
MAQIWGKPNTITTIYVFTVLNELSRKTGGKRKFNILQPGVHPSRCGSVVILASSEFKFPLLKS